MIADNTITLDIMNYIMSCKHTPIVVCIGSDRVVGDSLAPIVGELLKSRYNVPTYVYGDCSYNITASTIKDDISSIRVKHNNSPIIVVDAMLGTPDQVGRIMHYLGGCYPASVYGGGIGKVGDYTILGVVGCKGYNSAEFMMGTKANNVYKLASVIAYSIYRAFDYTQILGSSMTKLDTKKLDNSL